MKKSRRNGCRHVLVCLFLVTNRPAFAAHVELQDEDVAPVSVPVQWPETSRVEHWLTQEMQGASRANRPALAVTAPPAVSGRPGGSARPAVELVALYGVGTALAADVRIGSRIHAVSSASAAAGKGSGDRGRGREASELSVESIEGRCMRLRYRSGLRKVCLELERTEGKADAH